MNNFVQSIIVETSSTPTSSAVVLLFLFSFYYCDIVVIEPFPIDITLPVWLLKSAWTAKEASTYHSEMFNSSALNVSTNFLVPSRYFIKHISFSQSSVSGFHSCTEVRSCPFCQKQTLCFVVWKASAFSFSYFCDVVSFCPNKSSDSGVSATSFSSNVMGNYSNISFT